MVKNTNKENINKIGNKVSNNKKSIIIDILIFAVGFILAAGLVYGYFTFFKKDLIDDYYYYINGDYEVDSEEMVSTFTKAQDEVDDRVTGIITDIRNNKSNEKDNNIDYLYQEYINTDKRNSNGLGSLSNYIDKLNSVSNINELIDVGINIEKELNINIFTSYDYLSDFKDSTSNILYFGDIPGDYGTTPVYYQEKEYRIVKAYFRQYNIKLLMAYGYKEGKSKDIAKEIEDFYVDVFSNALTSEELNNYDNYYHLVDISYLQSIYTNIDMYKYFNELGLDTNSKFSLIDENNYKAVNSYLTDEHVDLWKNIILVKILQTYGIYTTTELEEVMSGINNILLGYDEYNVEYNANKFISDMYSDYIDSIYDSKYFGDEYKEYVRNMTNDILEEYEDILKNNTWLSDSTKNYAIQKLKNIKINIGYIDNGSCEDSYVIDKNIPLVDNVIAMNKVYREYLMNNKKSPSEFTQTLVNAAYYPLDNSINILSADSSLFSLSDDYYTNLGSIGMIIGHEITHAFDPTGAKFNAKGELDDWWTEDDKTKYNEIKNKVIKYYNNYNVTAGIALDGEKTVGENIADIGALEVTTKILNNRTTNKEDMQKYFGSYAKLWANNYSDMQVVLQMMEDVHSPNKIRVNATLPLISSFYDAYDLSEDDAMYLDEEERINIW